MTTSADKKRKPDEELTKDDGSSSLLMQELETDSPDLFLVPNSEFTTEARQRIEAWSDNKDDTAWVLVCSCDSKYPCDRPKDALHGSLLKHAVNGPMSKMTELKITRVYQLPFPGLSG